MYGLKTWQARAEPRRETRRGKCGAMLAWWRGLPVVLFNWCCALSLLAGSVEAAAEAAGTAEESARMGATHLLREDNGKTVDLRVGDRLIVRLHENPTTGFVWAVVGEDDRLVFVDSEYSAPAGEAIGGGDGLRTLTFFAERAGAASIQLRLWQAWEGESSVVEEFRAEVRISE